MKKSPSTSSARAETDLKIKELKRQIPAAQARADEARRMAQAAKAEFKAARKIYRQAKKAAKAARKEAKALKHTLEEFKPAAVKRRKPPAVERRMGSLTAHPPGMTGTPVIPVAAESVRAGESAPGAGSEAPGLTALVASAATKARRNPVTRASLGVPASGDAGAGGAGGETPLPGRPALS